MGTQLCFARLVDEVIDQIDHRVGRVRIKLDRVGILISEDIAGILDDGELHSQTDPQIRDIVFAGITDRFDFTLDTAIPEAAGNVNRIAVAQERFGTLCFDLLRIYPVDRYAGIEVGTRVDQRFDKRFV